MKRIIWLFAAVLMMASCSLDDDNTQRPTYETLAIDSVEMPEEFQLGEIYEIKLTYTKPSDCYFFYDYYFAIDGNQRTVAIVDTVYENDNCSTEPVEEEISFNFEVRYTGTYVFRFWQGRDENGTDNYYIIEVPVVE